MRNAASILTPAVVLSVSKWRNVDTRADHTSNRTEWSRISSSRWMGISQDCVQATPTDNAAA